MAIDRRRRRAPRGGGGRLLLVLLVVLGIVVAMRLTSPRPSAPTADVAVAIPAPAPPAGTSSPQPDREPYYTVRAEDIVDGRRFFVRNQLGGPIQVEVRFDKVDNMDSDPVLPVRLAIPPLDERAVVDLRHRDPTRDASFALGWEAIQGSAAARHSDAARYRVPFRAGTAWTLDQGFDGAFSHRLPESRHALDFGVQAGTPVLAARPGVVMEIEDDYAGGGADFARYADRANSVRVLHDDGSMGVYAHLDTGSATVRVGDRVDAGALLARSGATGYVSGPHLHFAVQVNAGMRLASVPFDMDGVDENDRSR